MFGRNQDAAEAARRRLERLSPYERSKLAQHASWTRWTPEARRKHKLAWWRRRLDRCLQALAKTPDEQVDDCLEAERKLRVSPQINRQTERSQGITFGLQR